MRCILAVIGTDKPGIIAAVSGLLAEHRINIIEISQTVMDGNFTMIMSVDLSGGDLDFSALLDECRALGDRSGVAIHLQHEGIFNARHRI